MHILFPHKFGWEKCALYMANYGNAFIRRDMRSRVGEMISVSTGVDTGKAPVHKCRREPAPRTRPAGTWSMDSPTSGAREGSHAAAVLLFQLYPQLPFAELPFAELAHAVLCWHTYTVRPSHRQALLWHSRQRKCAREVFVLPSSLSHVLLVIQLQTDSIFSFSSFLTFIFSITV